MDFTPNWPTCQEDVNPSCVGVQVSGFDRCLTHLRHDDLEQVLSGLGPGADLDARGTTFDAELLGRVLQAIGTGDTGSVRPQFGEVRFEHARFAADASFARVHFARTAKFDKAQFSESAEFRSARFSEQAGFLGAQFSGNAWFTNVQFSGAEFRDARFTNAKFTDARFSGSAKFTDARFSGNAEFGGARFSGHALFTSARFNGNAWFTNAKFNQNAEFREARFRGEVRFRNAQFSAHAWFLSAHFTENAEFDGARFSAHARFADARFSANVRFDFAQFEAATGLGPLVAAELFLDDAVFSRSVVIEAETGLLSCRRTRFEEGVALRMRYASVNLERASFGRPSSLEGSHQAFRINTTQRNVVASVEQVQGWDQRAARSRDHAEVGTRGGQIETWVPGLTSLEGTDVSELLLTDVDMRWCRFAGAHHLDMLRIEGRCPFHEPPTGWSAGWAWPPLWRWTRRQVLAEEHAWRRRRPGRKSADWQSYPLGGNPVEVEPERLAVLYRSLRKALEDGKDEAGAGDFYYGEMEARRHTGPRRDRVVLTAYWLISGYGQRALRALAGLALLVVAITVLLVGTGLPSSSPAQLVAGTLQPAPTSAPQVVALQISDPPTTMPPVAQRWTWNRTGKALQLAMGSVVFRDGAQKLTPAGTWTVMAGRFLGPVFLALAVLAIRARVKR
ncbi:pentapeptide repeat-containing protein [Amycolatopsis decaplanina]|uniref:pentapeptide repeat-containing protein n=1 Tax=Amycolatopsis decaplanina TaxID=208441 RepID=UPI0013772D5E|nr:pentapeptide repeat-containing protein [Amycolatopsis decaplanina]